MNFSSGQLTFALIFLIAFVIGISYAYYKDRATIKTYYKRMPLYILLGIGVVVGFYIFLTKLL